MRASSILATGGPARLRLNRTIILRSLSLFRGLLRELAGFCAIFSLWERVPWRWRDRRALGPFQRQKARGRACAPPKKITRSIWRERAGAAGAPPTWRTFGGLTLAGGQK